MEEQINERLSQVQIWKRIFLMLLFAVVITLVRWIAWIPILLQLFFLLVSGEKNRHILSFGRGLAIYDYHLLLYLTFATDVLPFPFSPWNLSAELKYPDEN
ncbi:MAG: DUF4389 domain-containing protein [Methylococcales bacterium]|nr:DUF4389 domain-containing protein [Methylococcales bacterium]